METKINLIEILKDKPLNFKLYDAVRNIDVFLDEVLENINEIRCKLDEDGRQMIYYSHKVTLVDFEDGIVALVPSKGMRDWRKFLWKKGDVLVSNDGKTEIIFDKFDDDSYIMFSGKHGLDCSNGTRDDCGVNDWLPTDYFKKESEDAAKTYISIIERRLGGKLNMETLEIEKAQPKFKDWDFITIKLPRGRSLIGVFKSENDKKYYLHANLDSRDIITIREDSYCKKSTCIARLSTEEEKMHFFDVLAKKGKTWDAVKKQIIDLKPKWTPKPFDRVITRVDDDAIWTANIFSHIDQHGEYVTIGCVGGYPYCIPYNEETAHLLGTTDDWEGGEQ